MIRIVERITASAIWDIEGTQVRLIYRRDCPETVMIQKIMEFRKILIDRSYEQNNSGLCEAFCFFGGIAFVGIAMSSRNEFFDCFSHYAKQFAEEWAAGEKRLKSKFIGYEYVFAKMLQNENIPIKYDFRYILGSVAESEQFCQITERRFAEYWIRVMLPLMSTGGSLAEIARRVGDVRVSRYLMQVPEQTATYVKALASAYTIRRELISLTKVNAYIFGNDSRTNFTGADQGLLELVTKVVSEEVTLQTVKFVAENRKELLLSKDVWRLYQKHGIRLKLLTIDFTVIKKLSLRSELKHFLKNRFCGSIRSSDRMFISLFDAVNRLYNINPDIHYFGDVDFTDVKNLQLAMENELTQSQIMTLFSALKTLYHYLCSDENDSRTPSVRQNPMEALRFVNASEFHENTPYIPDAVVTALAEKVNELDEIDRLVFQIFAETGMRAKEVAFLEADCLEIARYDGAAILKFIPYKTLKARRRNGLDDYHRIYISEELAALIRQQTAKSEAIRKENNLPYIFLHQKRDYKVSMLNVPYFIKKINDVILKYHICDESGIPWNFTSRQCRKTLVVNMIENGATTNELVYALGHLSSGTVGKYYAEVRKKRLADMNSEFFNREFELLLSGEQLADFTEEERRLLFVDFRLGKRRVELGFCTRKLCDGACKNRSRIVHCVNCPQLCTGRQYLPYWKKLLQSQQERMQTLLDSYHEAGLSDYGDFIEYQQEHRLLLEYQNTIEKIEESEVDRP